MSERGQETRHRTALEGQAVLDDANNRIVELERELAEEWSQRKACTDAVLKLRRELAEEGERYGALEHRAVAYRRHIRDLRRELAEERRIHIPAEPTRGGLMQVATLVNRIEALEAVLRDARRVLVEAEEECLPIDASGAIRTIDAALDARGSSDLRQLLYLLLTTGRFGDAERMLDLMDGDRSLTFADAEAKVDAEAFGGAAGAPGEEKHE